MSFLVPSQRGFESSSHNQPALSELPIHQNSRLQMPNSPSFDAYPSHSALPSSSAPPSTAQSSSFVPDHPPPMPALPKVGQTRCYWALLSSDLRFIYMDPVLASHLDEQADALVGKSLLAFVHPDEQASAKTDLGSVLDSRTLHGSVTRVRYSRLSRVRRQLGYEGPKPDWTEAEKIALDSNYMAVDIVINWAAEGLVLCFIHAIVDLTPHDNDEQHKTDWTNWCGTPFMSMEQISLLFQRLLAYIPQSGSMSRVFQILSNQPDRRLLMSWPPDQGQGQGPTGRDFAKLVEDVQIGTGMPSATDAKTSCTRRYKALQTMPHALGGEVESIFIPHGTVIFACHKANPPSRNSGNPTTAMQQLGYSSNGYPAPQQSTGFYEQSNSYALPPLASPAAPYHNYMSQQQPQHVSAPYSPTSTWSQQGNEPSMSNMRSGSYPPPQPPQQQQWSSQATSPYIESPNSMQAPFNRSLSPNAYYASGGGGSDGASPAPGDAVPPARRRVSPGSTREQYGPGGRSAGNRPVGVVRCSSCKATQSPEWRKGPSGKKELCNACGLRYARSRAKKEGHNLSQRRRKDKNLAKRDSATPPTPVSYSAIRRNYDDSFSSTGSGSGSEMYSHSMHGLEEMTPSPSPPASSSHINFVHYSPQTDNRQSYSTTGTSSFYSVPSPLSSNPPVLHGNHTHHPRLENIPSYNGRLSPMLSATSPVSTTMAPASFERERDRDRELPPTPISAEPRYSSRRSILQQ